MATAGERYDHRTGNIWSYAHRGDLTGLRAALARDVSPDLVNTVGWTPCHAAAAGGQTKALRLLAKMGADLEIADNGGNLPAHQAAKNGHAHTLKALQELGADIAKVRLSQAKGKETREVLTEAYRKVGVSNDDGMGDEDIAPVGYARKQAKSTAFWGPRRMPISTKIKKKIIKDKRKMKKEKRDSLLNASRESEEEGGKMNDAIEETEHSTPEPSYIDTVRQVKRDKKQRRRQKQGRNEQRVCQTEEVQAGANAERGTCCSDETSADANISEDEQEHNNTSPDINGFAALLLMGEIESSSEDED